MKTRIMYVQRKTEGPGGPARIGRVTFSRTGTLYYRGQRFQSLKGMGFKANYFDVATGEHYWIAGCRRDGADAPYGGGRHATVAIDEDVRQEYWTVIRGTPANKTRRVA